MLKNERGQSLVEMAIITPILLMMFLGLFEVGYVLRNYLVITNVTREAARFATKPNNLTVTDSDVIGYNEVISHSVTSAAAQLHNELYKPGESGLVVSNIIASVTITDCQNNNYHVIYPGEFGRDDLSHSTAPQYTSRLDYLAEAQKVGERHMDIACRYRDEGGHPLGIPQEHVVIVEMWYTSYQLLGVPLVSNPLSDPIPLYSKAVMRKTTGRDFY